MNRTKSARRAVASVRGRAVLSLGVVLALGVSGTFAYWSDSASVSGLTIKTGTIDLKVAAPSGGTYLDSVSNFGSLNIANMVPGNSSAALVSVKNTGTAPLNYTLSSSATDTAPLGLGAALAPTVTTGTVSGTSPSATCTGTGTAVLSAGASSFNGSLVGTARTLAPGASETLCIAAALPSNAATALQGASTSIVLSFNGTSF